MDHVRQQAFRLEAVHAQHQQVKLDRWSARKPELKQYITALSQSKELLVEDIKQTEARVSSAQQPIVAPPATPSRAARPGSTSPFANKSDAELATEQSRLRDALVHINGQILSTKAVFAQPRREEEKELWEAQLVILQDTYRMHQEEIDLMEVEVISRARMQRLMKERAVAEQSGIAQLARLQEQLNTNGTRTNEYKRELYFPAVKGYNFAFGGRGIYFGGKDVLVSELSGAFAITAQTDKADRHGVFKSARISVQFGGPHLASAQRGSNSQAAVANRTAAVTQSFQLRPSSATQSAAHKPPTSAAPSPAAPPAANPITDAVPASRLTADSDSNLVNSHKQPLPAPQISQQGVPIQPQGYRGSEQQADVSGHSTHQQQSQALQQTLNLHQNDVYSPLRASAPYQESAQDGQAERRMSSSLASTSADGLAFGMYSGAGPEAGALPPRAPEHQSRSKRLATKMLKKLGTKDRFRNPHPEQPGSGPGLQSSRPAYSPDAFDDHAKKGSKLAQRLLGGGKSVTGKLMPEKKLVFGSHVAGRSNHTWSNGLDNGEFEGASTSRAAEVQQDVMEAATEAEGGPQTPRTPTTEDLEYDIVGTPRQTSDYQGSPSLPTIPQQPPPRNLSRNSSLGSQAQAQTPVDDEVDVGQSISYQHGQFPRQDSASSALPAREAAAGFKGALKKVANGIAGTEFWEGATDRGSEAGLDSVSGSGGHRKGLFVVVRLSEVGLIGEKGTKVPNASIAEISVEVELCLTFNFEYTSVQGWHTAVKPVFEVVSLERKALGASVPLPKTVIRYILSAVLPRVLQRKLLGLLPQELGQYMLDAGQAGRLAGEITIVGPPLSSLDAELAFHPEAVARSKDARKQAQMAAAAQEARGMLGMSLEQAQLLAELFSGKNGLLSTPLPCNIAELQAYYSRHHGDPAVWTPLCDAWDRALQMLSRANGVTPLSFRTLMEGHVAHQLLKPVRARVTLSQASISLNADAIMTAVRDFMERSARETSAKEEASGRRTDESESLETQLQVLETFYTFAAGKLHTFKGKFKHATGSVMAQANARNYALGVEGLSYEGPLRVRLPVKKKLDPDGSFSFEIPLPNPDRQVILKRFAGGFKQALSSPLTVHQVASQIAAQTAAADPASAPQPPAPDTPQSDAGSEEEVLPDWGHDESGKPPLKLGKVIVDGMRVRVRLDQQRIGSLLQGISPQAMGSQFADVASGVLSMLGDMASLSFAGYHPDGGSDAHFVLNMESSDVSNLNAELTQLGFRSGEGVSPGRTLRIVQAISRAILLTTGRSPKSLKGFDSNWHRHLTKETMDVAVCLAAESNVHRNSKSEPLMVHVAGTSDDAFGTKPLSVTNEIELVSMIRALKGDETPGQTEN
ncbi:TPA: hypothetical protein ACH3X2_005818 [Trebouxia sp. C0005]